MYIQTIAVFLQLVVVGGGFCLSNVSNVLVQESEYVTRIEQGQVGR